MRPLRRIELLGFLLTRRRAAVRLGWVIAAGALGLALAGCRPELSELERLRRSLPPQPGQNVIVVSFDALRADALGVYGSPRQTSPHLDAFAAESVVFRRGPLKLIQTCKPERAQVLYDLAADPAELRDFRPERPQVTRDLHRELEVVMGGSALRRDARRGPRHEPHGRAVAREHRGSEGPRLPR